MMIGYDDVTGGLAFIPEVCGECGGPHSDTGCDAPGCHAVAFLCCGTGCDYDADPQHGRCARASAAESPQERAARAERERAFFGLPRVGAG